MFLYDVSVIIPVYNGERYLKDCLDSLKAQTLKNIQTIIVNDGSIDNSLKIIEEYSDDNVTVINKKNEGLGAARNTGLEYVKGKYIAFLDCDDVIDKNMYEAMYKKAEDNNLDIVICGTTYWFDDRDNINKVYDYFKEDKVYSNKDVLKEYLLDNVPGYACDKLYKANLFNTGIRYSVGVYYEDTYTTARLFNKCERIGFINEAFYKYRQWNEGISRNLTSKHVKDFSQQINNVVNLLSEDKKYEDLREYIEAFRINNMITTITSHIKANNYERRKIYNTIKENNMLLDDISLISIMKKKLVRKNSKIKIILWKLKIYDLVLKMKYGIKGGA